MTTSKSYPTKILFSAFLLLALNASIKAQCSITNQTAFLTSTGNPTLAASWWIIEGSGIAKDFSANANDASSLTGTGQVESPIPYCNTVMVATPTVTVASNTTTITLTSAVGTDAQTACINTPITNITYSTTGATGATFSGLPAGVTGNWADNVVTISGSPTTTVGSPFNYTVTLTGGSSSTMATGSITVIPTPIVSISGGGTYCGGATVILSATAGFASYDWFKFTSAGYTSLGVATPTLTVTQSGNYRVIVSNGSCTRAALTVVLIGDYIFTGSMSAGDATTATRIFLGAGTSFCATPKVCPGNSGEAGPFAYDLYPVTNITANPVCAVIGLSGNCGEFISASAYLGSFDPANNCTNYLGDLGSSLIGGPLVMEVTVPPGATIVIKVNNFTSGQYCDNYRLIVDMPRAPAGISVSPSSPQCSGTPITLTASPANSYLWSPGGATTQSIIHNSGTINYTVTLGFGNVGCNTTISQSVTVGPPSVNPVSNQAFCSGANAVITFTGGDVGTVYNWTNTNPAIGLAAGGSGSLNFTATNATAAPISGTIQVTPVNGGCTGTPISFSITVNPSPNAVATPPSQTICSGAAITTIALSGNVGGTVYNWTRDNNVAVTGIAANGAGDISGALTNITNAPVMVTFTITPMANSCPGAAITATVLVNPTPNAVATPPSQTICSGAAITTIALSGNVAGTVYNWTRDNIGAVTGIAANGAGDISGTLTNTTNAPVTVTFTITPTANSCPGTAITATVLVNPTSNAVATPPSQTVCNNSATSIGLSSSVPGTTFSWIVQSTTGTVSGQSASSGTTIAQTLTNSGTSAATVTYRITPTGPGPDNCAGPTTDVTITVSPSPVITCPNPVTVNSSADGTGNCSGTATWTHPTIAPGSCGPITLTMSIDGGTAVSVTPGSSATQTLSVGPHTVTYVVSDGKTQNPNTATCSFTVTVVDNEPPTLVCKTTTVFLNSVGNYTLLVADVFNAAASPDNCPGVLTVTNISPATVNCNQVGQTIPVTVTVQDAAGNSATCIAQITVQEGTTLPSDWSSNNVGNANGSAGYKACTSNGQFTVTATGFSTSSSDVLHLTSRQLCGNGEIIAHVASVSNGGWGGIMLRESLAQGSKMVALKTQLNSIIRREIRSATNGPASLLNFNRPQHTWLRLVRNGSNFVGYTSHNGTTWAFAFSATVSMTGCIHAGLFAESVNNNVVTTAVFDNVTVTGASAPLAAPDAPATVNTAAPDFEVYPNPTTGEVTVDLSAYANRAVRLEVYDIQGKVLKVLEIESVEIATERLDFSEYQNGIYLIRVQSVGADNVLPVPDAAKRVIVNGIK